VVVYQTLNQLNFVSFGSYLLCFIRITYLPNIAIVYSENIYISTESLLFHKNPTDVIYVSITYLSHITIVYSENKVYISTESLCKMQRLRTN